MLAPSSIEPVATAVGEVVEIGDRVKVRGDNLADLGNGLHAVIAANSSTRCRMTTRSAARRFARHLKDRFGANRVDVEAPVSLRRDDGLVIRSFVDALAETAQGWVVIDHKSSLLPRSAWPDEALRYAGQLGAYRDVLLGAGRDVAGRHVHFCSDRQAGADRHPVKPTIADLAGRQCDACVRGDWGAPVYQPCVADCV